MLFLLDLLAWYYFFFSSRGNLVEYGKLLSFVPIAVNFSVLTLFILNRFELNFHPNLDLVLPILLSFTLALAFTSNQRLSTGYSNRIKTRSSKGYTMIEHVLYFTLTVSPMLLL